jgi:hypothetical protein
VTIKANIVFSFYEATPFMLGFLVQISITDLDAASLFCRLLKVFDGADLDAASSFCRPHKTLVRFFPK